MRVYNLPTEKQLLLAMLERPKLRSYCFQHLHPTIFGGEFSREVFERMLALQTIGRNIPTAGVMCQDPGLSDAAQTFIKMRPKDRAEVGKLERSDIDHLLDRIRWFYKKRTFYEMSKWVAAELSDQNMPDMDEVKAEVQKRLVSLDTYDDLSANLQIVGQGANITDDYFRRHVTRSTMSSIKTGYSVIDDRANWSRGNLVLLTAKRGKGKSLLAKSLGLSHFCQGQNVYTVNLEMEKWEYLCRLFAETSPFTHDQLRKGFELGEPKRDKKGRVLRDEYGNVRYVDSDDNPIDPDVRRKSRANIRKALGAKKAMDAEGMKKNCRWALRTVSSPTYTPMQLNNELRHQGYDVVIIDYLNLFKQVHKDLWQSLYMHTKYLKMMAKELGVLLYVLAQLNEEGRAKYGKAAEEDADAWLYWDIPIGSPKIKIFHGKARHYKPYPFELVFNYNNLGFIEESDLGTVCPNKKCQGEFEADPASQAKDMKTEAAELRERGRDRAAKKLEQQIPYLAEGRCPYCATGEVSKARRLMSQLDHLTRIAEKDAEEQEEALAAVEADERRTSEKDRAKRTKSKSKDAA